MADGNATNVGSIVGKLKIDSSEWHRELSQAEAKANQLGRSNPKIKVETTGAPQAVAALSAVAAAEEKVSASSAALARMRAQGQAVTAAQAITEREAVKPIMSFTEWTQRSADATDRDTEAKGRNAEANRKVDSTAKQAGGSMHLLYSSLAMLAPAVVPLAGAAVAGAGAFGVLGAAGILAIVGIKNEIETGAPLANQYTEGINTLKEQFIALSRTSAVGMIGSFNRAVAIMDSYMPSLNRQTDQYSRILGDMGTNTLSGLLGSFQTLNPVFQAFTTYLHGLTEGLTGIGSSNGLEKFGDYALATMPLVTSTLESLIAGVANLIQALSPLGNLALTTLGVVGDILAGIPTDVLTVLIGGALGAYAAFASWSALIPIIQSFGIMLNVSLGPIGLVVAGVGLLAGLMLGAAASTDKATGATIGYTAALERDNGAIGENVRAHAAQEIAKSKAAGAAEKLGINLGLLRDAALGNADAQAKVNSELDRLDSVAKSSTGTTKEMGGINLDVVKSNKEMQASVSLVREELTNQNSSLNASVEQQRRFKAAMEESNAGAAAQSSELSIMAQIYGTSASAVSGVTDAETKAAEQLANTTLQMQLQSDASGLLKMQLDELNGKGLSLEQAQTRAAQSLNSVTKSFQQNGTAIVGTTEAAVANQSALQNKVAADQAAAEAVGKSTGSTEEATKAYGKSKTALEDSMRSQGLLTEEVQAYINKLYNVDNLKVKPTKVDVDKAEAELKLQGFQTAINSLTGKTVHIYSVEHIQQIRESGDTAVANSMDAANQYATGNAYRAKGGLVNYLSTGGMPQFVPSGTDTVPAMLTPGEIVIKKSSVDSIGAGALLHANETGRLPGNGNIVVYIGDEAINPKLIRVVQQEMDNVSRQVGGMRK